MTFFYLYNTKKYHKRQYIPGILLCNYDSFICLHTKAHFGHLV